MAYLKLTFGSRVVDQSPCFAHAYRRHRFMPRPIPNFAFDSAGKPQIGCDDRSLFSFGNLIRQTEQLILDLFGRGLLSGTTHTCLGQELCQMAVVRALQHDDDVVLSNQNRSVRSAVM